MSITGRIFVVYGFTELMMGYRDKRSPEAVEEALRRLRAVPRCGPSVVTFTVLAEAYAMVGRMEEAWQVVERRMPAARKLPNKHTWNALLGGYADMEDREAAKAGVALMRERMKAAGFEPPELLYSTLVAACGPDKGEVDAVLQEMREKGLQITVWVQYARARHLQRAGYCLDTTLDVDAMFDELGLTPQPGTRQGSSDSDGGDGGRPIYLQGDSGGSSGAAVLGLGSGGGVHG